MRPLLTTISTQLPRHHTPRSLRPSSLTRAFTSHHPQSSSTPFKRPGPAPPPLPKADQEVFERLQRSSTGAFSTPTTERYLSPSKTPSQDPNKAQDEQESKVNAQIPADGDGGELHPDVRRGVKAEFEGERNPKTGESGGPKNEPLRWGEGGDWSYNGRVTDF